MMGGASGGAGGQGQKRKASASSEGPPQKKQATGDNWKVKLNTAYARHHKGITKESITFHTEGEGPFTSVAMSEQFAESYTGEGSTKKEAEEAAAKAAIEAEFPDQLAKLAKPAKAKNKQGNDGGMQAMMQAMLAAGGGGEGGEPSMKEKVMQALPRMAK